MSRRFFFLAAALALLGSSASAGPTPVSPQYVGSGVSPITGSFTATGQSSAFIPVAGRGFNASIWGTFVANCQLERSFNGSTWLTLTAAGTQLYVWSAPASEENVEPEYNVSYRLNCTSYTSGTVNYRISQ